MINTELKKLLLDRTLYEFGCNLHKYTDCGPWISYVLSDGTERYYEDHGAHATLEELEEQDLAITEVQLGSIVEGSDFDVTPISLTVDETFTCEAFWSAVKEINDKASEIWKIVNAHYYTIKRHDTDEVLCWCEWEDFASGPRVPAVSDPLYPLAWAAGRQLVESAEDRIEFAGHPELYIQREDQPDIL